MNSQTTAFMTESVRFEILRAAALEGFVVGFTLLLLIAMTRSLHRVQRASTNLDVTGVSGVWEAPHYESGTQTILRRMQDRAERVLTKLGLPGKNKEHVLPPDGFVAELLRQVTARRRLDVMAADGLDILGMLSVDGDPSRGPMPALRGTSIRMLLLPTRSSTVDPQRKRMSCAEVALARLERSTEDHERRLRHSLQLMKVWEQQHGLSFQLRFLESRPSFSYLQSGDRVWAQVFGPDDQLWIEFEDSGARTNFGTGLTDLYATEWARGRTTIAGSPTENLTSTGMSGQEMTAPAEQVPTLLTPTPRLEAPEPASSSDSLFSTTPEITQSATPADEPVQEASPPEANPSFAQPSQTETPIASAPVIGTPATPAPTTPERSPLFSQPTPPESSPALAAQHSEPTEAISIPTLDTPVSMPEPPTTTSVPPMTIEEAPVAPIAPPAAARPERTFTAPPITSPNRDDEESFHALFGTSASAPAAETPVYGTHHPLPETPAAAPAYPTAPIASTPPIPTPTAASADTHAPTPSAVPDWLQQQKASHTLAQSGNLTGTPGAAPESLFASPEPQHEPLLTERAAPAADIENPQTWASDLEAAASGAAPMPATPAAPIPPTAGLPSHFPLPPPAASQEAPAAPAEPQAITPPTGQTESRYLRKTGPRSVAQRAQQPIR